VNNTVGIVLTGGKHPALKDLASMRSVSAVPVGSKYRAIDFVLSNMVNSGIKKVGIITQFSYRSLMDHLGSGKEWDLDRRHDGLFIFPPSLEENDTGWYKGTSDAIYNNLMFLNRSSEEYVIISQGNLVFKMDFNKMLQYHLQKDSDMTIAYKEMSDSPINELQQMGILAVSEDGRICDLQEKPLTPLTNNASMGIYLMKRKLLISLVEECAAHGTYDLVKDIIIRKVPSLKIFGYKFEGYWRNLVNINNYYRCNMELLDPGIYAELFQKNWKIYTKVKDEAPAKYNEEAEVRNSILGDGCIIEGTVDSSVLFRGVTVQKGAIVRDSIIMQDSKIEEGAVVEYAIIDKGVTLTRSKYIKGDRSWPAVISKNAIV